MTGDEARLSGTEVQLLVHLVSGVKSTVDDISRRLDGMVPRPEFVQHQDAVSHRISALEQKVDNAITEHGVLRKEIEAVEDEHDASEEKRAADFADLNRRAWGALGGAIIAVIVGVAVALISHVF